MDPTSQAAIKLKAQLIKQKSSTLKLNSRMSNYIDKSTDLSRKKNRSKNIEVKYNTERIEYTGNDLVKHQEAKLFFKKAVEFGNHLKAFKKGNHLRSLLFLLLIL